MEVLAACYVFILIIVMCGVAYMVISDDPEKCNHQWRALEYNRLGLSTLEECPKCGTTREIVAYPSDDGQSINHWWLYSNGKKEPDERVSKHE